MGVSKCVHFGVFSRVRQRVLCCLRAHEQGPSVESKDVGKVDEALLDEVEADVYWCLTKLLDNIQVPLLSHLRSNLY